MFVTWKPTFEISVMAKLQYAVTAGHNTLCNTCGPACPCMSMKLNPLSRGGESIASQVPLLPDNFPQER